jgi:hypothetical protein
MADSEAKIVKMHIDGQSKLRQKYIVKTAHLNSISVTNFYPLRKYNTYPFYEIYSK